MRCSDNGPEIRFPFRLKELQPEHCGYSGFDLSCSPTNQTLLDLPVSIKAVVMRIDYESQRIVITDLAPSHRHRSVLQQLLPLNLSASPFQFASDFGFSFIFSFLRCPSKLYPNPLHFLPFKTLMEPTLTSCLGDENTSLYPVLPHSAISELSPLSCRKLFTISLLQNPQFPYPPNEYFYQNAYLIDWCRLHFPLNWSTPECWRCESENRYCRLRNNSAKVPTECYGSLPTPNGFLPTPTVMSYTPMQSGPSRMPMVAGLISSLSLLVIIFIATYGIHRSNATKKEDQVRIQKFLEDYKAFKPARYTYADIKRITNQFKERVGQGGYGTVYKGKLSNDAHVAVKMLHNLEGDGDDFVNEVGIIGRIHHVNVVRLVGYCADGFKRALIYEFLSNDSLEKFISSNQEKLSLGWKRLQDIAMGIARGIEYLHQGCEQRILHFDIKPHNILLDQDFNPKISDFGLAKLCSKEKSVISITAARGTIGYIAPEVFSRNFGNVSYKSDVYSFGMLLLEMVGGRKSNNVPKQNTNELYFPEWIYNRLEKGEELEIQIEADEDAKIVNKLTIVGLWCIQWYPIDRPSMKIVLQMLEGDGNNLSMPPNPFASTNPTKARRTMGGRNFTSELEVISES
ncbi:Glycerophosphodiester phosphodiesterase [Bertholletia excelsa]